MTLDLKPSDCQEVHDEVQTLQQELSTVLAEIRLFAQGLKNGDYDDISDKEYTVRDFVVEVLEEIVKGDR